MVTSTIAAHDTVVSTASELIGGIMDLVAGPDGRLYIADFQSNSILSIRMDGTDPRTIGRAGSGPGEFRFPWALAVSHDTLRVYDMGNGRVQILDLTGAYFGQYTPDVPRIGGGRALNERGALAAATGGRDSALVVVVRGDEAGRISLGEPVVPPVTFFDFGSIRERILSGEIPDEYRNDVLPVWGEDESVFVAFYTEPEIRRYDPEGNLLWAQRIDEPALAAAREAFVRKNRENQNPSQLFTLRYFLDGQVVDGDLWVLLNSEDEEDGIVLVLDGDTGELKRRVVLSGLASVGHLAIDPARGRMYVTIPDEAMVVAFSLE